MRLTESAFWGPAIQNVVSHSKSFVSLSNCYFSSGRQKEKALIEADSGKLQVEGCSFATPELSILLGKELKHAIVSGNNGEKGVTITPIEKLALLHDWSALAPLISRLTYPHPSAGP